MAKQETASKHTPAPWYADDCSVFTGTRARGESLRHVALTYDGSGVETKVADWDYEVMRANAHLIAAAPDLLEALEGIAEALHELASDEEATALFPQHGDWHNCQHQACSRSRSAIAKAKGQ